MNNQLQRSLRFLIVFCTGLLAVTAVGQEAQKDIVYATADQTELKLDFYAGAEQGPSPLIVWVHGGAWRRGDKSNVPIQPLSRYGFAIASVNYRLSEEAKFPAQVNDIKAAIRFLRGSAERFDIDPKRIVIAGASAGGHLAALVGVSDSVPGLEDVSMGNADFKSDVAAIVSLYGASNLQTILSQSTPHGLGVRVPALQLLLGDAPENVPDVAKLASPVTHVDLSDPPLLLIHGDQDPQMPINQSHELEGVYRRKELDVTFHVVHGAAHGGRVFYDDAHLKMIADWITSRLR